MASKQSPGSTRTETTGTSKRIKNTFSSATNEYFTPATLFLACKSGLPFEKLPKEAKKMLLEYEEECAKKCSKTGKGVEIPQFSTGPHVRL